MKKILLLLLSLWAGGVVAQNFADTLASLRYKPSAPQLAMLKTANKHWKKADKEYVRWQKALEQVRQTELSAQQAQQAKEKHSLLTKILVAQQQADQYEVHYLQQTSEAMLGYAALFEQVLLANDTLADPRANALVNDLAEQAAKKMRKSASKRKKGERGADLVQQLTALRDAFGAEQAALSDWVYATKLRTQQIAMQEPETIYLEDKYLVASLDSPSPPQEGVFSEVHIVYRVQIAASERELSAEELYKIYSPPAGQIIYNQIDGDWYKYAVGRFHSYEEASAFKAKAGIPGAFVIAFQDNQRIQLPELKNQPTAANSKSKTKLDVVDGKEILYRVQLAATRQPARLLQIKSMRLGGQIVNILQADGWYKYTVGNYPTRAEADQALSSLHVKGAFVVAYSLDGEEMSLPK